MVLGHIDAQRLIRRSATSPGPGELSAIRRLACTQDRRQSEWPVDGGTLCLGIEAVEKPELIVSDPKIMVGKPIIRGTRITVELILEKFAAGYTEDEILRAHPHITRDGVRAALAFAAEALQASVLYPLERVGR